MLDSSLFMLAILIGENSHHDDGADSDLLPKSGNVQQVAAITQNPHDERPNHRSENGSLAAGKTGATDHTRSDDVQFIARSGGRLAGAQTRGQNDPGKATQQSIDCINFEQILREIYSG